MLQYDCTQSKEVIKQYKPFLDPPDLTYTQYIIMMVMWERKEIMAKIGQCVKLSQEEAAMLYQLLYKILGSMGTRRED